MDRGELIKVFERIDDALDAPQTLCVIGASAVLGYGHATRQTDDIDVWRPASQINDRRIARAAAAAGIVIDRGTDLPEGVYMQLVDPGVVHLPAFEGGRWATGEAKVTLWSGESLTVEAPPPSIVAAAKLVRAEERDIDDCVYLVRAKNLSGDAIRWAIEEITDPMVREAAAGNLVILQVIVDRAPPRPEGEQGEGHGRSGRMTEREIWVKGVATLKAFLKDDLVLARAMKERDYATLLAVATIADRGLREPMAITDPALYTTLNQALVLMRVKGYGAMNIASLRELAKPR